MAAGYGTNGAADTYHSERGNAAWAAFTADQKTQARLRGSVWLDATYGGRFPGYKTGRREQEREWPRTGFEEETVMDRNCDLIPADEVPVEILNASYEAALREAASPGSLSPDFTAANAIKREKIGPMETEYFNAGGVEQALPIVTLIDGILAPLIGDSRSPILFGSAAHG